MKFEEIIRNNYTDEEVDHLYNVLDIETKAREINIAKQNIDKVIDYMLHKDFHLDTVLAALELASEEITELLEVDDHDE